METVLHRGPWPITHKSLILKPWTLRFKFDQEITCRVLVWVSFPNLDLSFWSTDGLSNWQVLFSHCCLLISA